MLKWRATTEAVTFDGVVELVYVLEVPSHGVTMWLHSDMTVAFANVDTCGYREGMRTSDAEREYEFVIGDFRRKLARDGMPDRGLEGVV